MIATEQTISSLPSENQQRRNYTSFHNATYNIISIVAYLIGVEKHHFENKAEPPQLPLYEELEKNKNARIIRNLCRIRTAFEQNYAKIRSEFYYNIKNIGTLPELIPVEAVEQLSNDGIVLQRSKPDNDFPTRSSIHTGDRGTLSLRQ